MKSSQAVGGVLLAGMLFMAGALSGTSALAKSGAGTTFLATDQVWSTNGVLNPFNNSSEVLYDDWYFDALALYKWETPTGYYPQLASSWSWKDHGTELVVNLNPKAKWSNDTPVTSQDVVTTWALEFEQDVAQGYFITKVAALGPRTVAFYRSAKVPESPAIFEYEVLMQPIYPAKVFQRFVPSDIWQLAQESEGYPVTKAVTAAQNKLSALGVKAAGVGFKPSQLIYNGPWALSKVTSSQQLLVKNPYFFAAKNVTANQVIYYNLTTNDIAWRMLEANQMDYANVAMTPPVWHAIQAVKGNMLALTGPAQGMEVRFNFADYPFNMVQVRQALAYATNRAQVQKIAEPVSGYLAKYQDGAYNNFNASWLTAQERGSLNPYNYSLKKAAALLKSVGFKDTKAGWVMPNGKPFSIKIYVMSPYSDYVEGADVLAAEWKAFGIHASAELQNGNIFFNDQTAGDYPVSIGTAVTSLFPFYQYQFYQTHDNYGVNAAGELYQTSKARSEQDIPTVVKVPGLGTVHPLTLVWKLMFTQPTTTERQEVWDLAKTTNYLMPYIEVFGQYSSNVVNEARWSWPSLKNPVWNGNGYGYGFVPLFQSLGLMKAK
jgi:peptide/nickel transport system substrate-binding protein